MARIFHASNGIVQMTDLGFEIRSAPPTETPAKVTAVVPYDDLNLLEGELPGAHQKLLETLERAADDKTAIKWHAYGTMAEADDEQGTAVLTLASLDHLYVEIPKSRDERP